MKSLVFLTVTLFCLFTLFFLAVDFWVGEEWIEQQLSTGLLSAEHRSLGLVGVYSLLTLDLLLPLPSSLLMTLSGALAGVWMGATVSLLGTMSMSSLGFLACRQWGRAAFSRFIGSKEEEEVREFVSRYGDWALLLSRGVPMLTEVVSCIAGLGEISWKRFLTFSALGSLPVCLFYGWIGATLREVEGSGWLLLLALSMPALAYGVFLLFRKALASG